MCQSMELTPLWTFIRLDGPDFLSCVFIAQLLARRVFPLPEVIMYKPQSPGLPFLYRHPRPPWSHPDHLYPETREYTLIHTSQSTVKTQSQQ